MTTSPMMFADKMREARKQLVFRYPFWSSIALGLIMEPKPVGTMATDGKRIFYDEEWVSKLTFEESMGVIAHESAHCGLLHPFRMQAHSYDLIFERTSPKTWLSTSKRQPGPAQAPAPREQFEPGARRRVALGLILNELIRKAGIQADAGQVQRRLDELVATYSDQDEARRQYLQNDAATRQLQMSVLEDQAIDWVVKHAQVTDQPGTFKDIMNFGAEASSEGLWG